MLMRESSVRVCGEEETLWIFAQIRYKDIDMER
jgi:hypothetical protein